MNIYRLDKHDSLSFDQEAKDKPLARFAGILWLVLCVSPCFSDGDNRLTPDEIKAGWELLFEGKTLDGWQFIGGPGAWSVEEGMITCEGTKKGYLATVEQFEDFRLSLEYKISPRANTGVFFRWANLKDFEHRGAELQIIDLPNERTPGRGSCGAIYEYKAPRFHAHRPPGEWNHIVLTCKGGIIWVDFNGRRTIYMNTARWTTPGMNPDGSTNKFTTALKDLPRQGHIALQDHGGKTWFRNVKIRRL